VDAAWVNDMAKEHQPGRRQLMEHQTEVETQMGVAQLIGETTYVAEEMESP
jgi:hypothetical protein